MDWTTKERRGAQEPQGGRAIHRSQLQPAPARPGALGSAGEGEEAATCPPTSPNPANSVMGQDRSQAARRSGQPTVQQFINGVGLLGRTPPAAFLLSRKTCH